LQVTTAIIKKNDILSKINRTDLIKEAKIELARRNFWHYCQIKFPTVYTESREYLRTLCNVLNNVYYGLPLDDGKIYKKLAISLPPQHYKTVTLVNWCQWILGKSTKERIIECSFNDTAAMDFSKYVRDGISEERNTQDQIIYSDIFSGSSLKYGDKSKGRWALDGEFFNFIGAGIGGSITGKGATIRIVDDPVKDLAIALNDNELLKQWQWFLGTFRSRKDANTPEPIEIINHTRWSKNDLLGRVLEAEADWYYLKMPAYNEQIDIMLCEDFLSREQYFSKRSTALKDPNTKMVFLANYQQSTVDEQDLLYHPQIYTQLPKDNNGNLLADYMGNYTDPADTGNCYLCSISYIVYQNIYYIIDVVYSNAPGEITEKLVSKSIFDNKITSVSIEGNGGQRTYGRMIKKILEDEYNWQPSFRYPVTTTNKDTRININSSKINQYFRFPANWMDKWPIFYKHVTEYKRTGKNEFKDAPDALTGVSEKRFV